VGLGSYYSETARRAGNDNLKIQTSPNSCARGLGKGKSRVWVEFHIDKKGSKGINRGIFKAHRKEIEP